MVGDPKDCPFCGSPPIRLEVCEDADDQHFVRCMTCGATGPDASSGYYWDDRETTPRQHKESG